MDGDQGKHVANMLALSMNHNCATTYFSFLNMILKIS